MKQSKSLDYNLADMRSANGESLRWQIESLASQTALEICKDLKTETSMCNLSTFIPDVFVELYFQRRIKQEIYPMIRSMCVIDWYVRNEVPLAGTTVTIHRQHALADLLKKHWPSNDIPLTIRSNFILNYFSPQPVHSVYNLGRQFAKRIIMAYRTNAQLIKPPDMPENSVAVHYCEGLEEDSRSDLFWFRQSDIDPQKILVFFDSVNSESAGTGKPIDSDTIEFIERNKLRWVCLEKLRINIKDAPYWSTTHRTYALFNAFNKTHNPTKNRLDKWINNLSRSLLCEVDYWQSFYSSFNIKLHIESEEGFDRGIAQRIAIDNVGGIHIGKQRSENLGWHDSQLGYHPHNVFFLWGNRSIEDLINTRNQISQFIISGYPYDYLFSDTQLSTKWRQNLNNNQAQFCIALFDEVFGNHLQYSKSMLINFYNSFLDMVITNRDIGLIIKSKKPEILKQLPEIQPKLKEALQTKRCLVVDNPQKRLPATASSAADISVGMGISSAITEAAISGARGFHYDSSQMLSHPFYTYGKDQFIFSNLDTLINAINRYENVSEPKSNAGDFSSVLDQLDPFRDGKAYHRIQKYISYLLESFDQGLQQQEAIDSANSRYASLWGQDKIISEKNV